MADQAAQAVSNANEMEQDTNHFFNPYLYNTQNSLVQQEAPNFTADVVMPNNQIQKINLKEYLDGEMGVVFFYPLDFTFVCPTEIISFSNAMNEFAARKTKVLGISVDSAFTHRAWRDTPTNKGGIDHIQYPLVSDLTKSISQDYGVLTEQGIALRGTFVIDAKGVIRHQSVNDLPIGRNVEEVLRIVDAIQFADEHGDVCPAGFKRGDSAMKPTAEGVADYLASHADNL